MGGAGKSLRVRGRDMIELKDYNCALGSFSAAPQLEVTR